MNNKLNKLKEMVEANTKAVISSAASTQEHAGADINKKMCLDCPFMKIDNIVKIKRCGICNCPIASKAYSSCPKNFFVKIEDADGNITWNRDLEAYTEAVTENK